MAEIQEGQGFHQPAERSRPTTPGYMQGLYQSQISSPVSDKTTQNCSRCISAGLVTEHVTSSWSLAGEGRGAWASHPRQWVEGLR